MDPDFDEEDIQSMTPEQKIALGIPTPSIFTVEGYIETIGTFGRGLRSRYPRAGRYVAAAILILFVLGFIDLNPFS